MRGFNDVDLLQWRRLGAAGSCSNTELSDDGCRLPLIDAYTIHLTPVHSPGRRFLGTLQGTLQGNTTGIVRTPCIYHKVPQAAYCYNSAHYSRYSRDLRLSVGELFYIYIMAVPVNIVHDVIMMT